MHTNLQKTIGVFKKHFNGYYSFRLKNGDIMVFEQIELNILKKFQLDTDIYSNVVFEITYVINEEESNDDDFLVFRLVDLKLIN